MNDQLFQMQDGQWLTIKDMEDALRQTGAQEADVLFVHTDMTFGMPNMNLSKKEIMAGMLKALTALEVGTICVPTFTFSFCNGREYDVNKSRTRMGAFNEYFRKQPGVIRSVDPLMSVALLGDKKYLVKDIGHESVGKDCTFDLLRREKGKVKFVFLGTKPSACFTYTHYMEYVLQVPYRYQRAFTGRITLPNGKTYEDTYELFVRYQGVEPTKRDDFERHLLSTGACTRQSCGDSFVYCVEKNVAFAEFSHEMKKNPMYLLDHAYPQKLVPEFHVDEEMVAL